MNRITLTLVASVIGLSGISQPALSANAFGNNQEFLERSSHVFNDLAKKASPAVVSISAIKSMNSMHGAIPPGMLPPGLPPDLFEEGPDGGFGNKALGIGSGVIIRSDGLILTNNHVVEHAERIDVTLDEKTRLRAKILGSDPKTDLAVIKLTNGPKNLPTIGFGDSDLIEVGDWTVAIGSPFGLNRTVTSGIISAKGRARMGMLDIEDFIQTDAAINPGNSGGPLLNSKGEMIGLNTAIFSQTGGYMGIGFAIPSKIAKQVTEELITRGWVARGWIGMSAQDVDEDLAKYFKVRSDKGAIVTQVSPKGPAGEAKLRTGDVILKFNDQPIESSSHLKSAVAKTKSGSTITLEITREGSVKQVPVVIREQPRPKTQQAGRAEPEKRAPDENIGLMVQDVPPDFAQVFKIQSGHGALVTAVAPGSVAFDAGLDGGDVILKVNDRDVKNSKHFVELAKGIKGKDVAVLYVQRGDEEKFFVPIKKQRDDA